MPSITEPSVKSLLIKMQFQGQQLATGTGFIVPSVKGPVLITNRHNVTGRSPYTDQPLHPTGGIPDELIIVHNRLGHLGQWVEKRELLFEGGNPRWYVHPVLCEKADFVALTLTELDDVAIHSYDPSNAGPKIHVGPADSLSVVGFPFGKTAGGSFPIWATGFMASEPDVNFDDLPVFQGLRMYQSWNNRSETIEIAILTCNTCTFKIDMA